MKLLRLKKRCNRLRDAYSYLSMINVLFIYSILLTAQKRMSHAYREIFRAVNQYPDIRYSLSLPSLLDL